MRHWFIISIFTFGISASQVVAQIETHSGAAVQVVTKSIQKSMAFELGSEVVIMGEKADVFLSTWDKNRIAVYLDLEAAHPDLAKAEADLEEMDYELEKQGHKIIIKNSIKPSKDKDRSKMNARYTIILPNTCPVNMSNVFGSAQIKDLARALVVNASYCDLQLTNLKGSIDITTAFGDITGRKISGKVKFKTSFTDMEFSEMAGTWDLEASQGVLKIDANNSVADFNVKADQMEVYFANPPVGLFNYEILTGMSKLELPPELSYTSRQISDNLSEVKLSTPTAQGNFRITAEYGKVTIGPLGN